MIGCTRLRWRRGVDRGDGAGKVVEPLDGGGAVGQHAAVRIGAGLRRVVVMAVGAGGRREKVGMSEAPGAVADVGIGGPGCAASGYS